MTPFLSIVEHLSGIQYLNVVKRVNIVCTTDGAGPVYQCAFRQGAGIDPGDGSW
jgi:hypothetical protein